MALDLQAQPMLERLKQSLWDDLHSASDLLRQGQVVPGLTLYRRILKRDILALFYVASDDSEANNQKTRYPLIELGFLVSHYYMHMREWKDWTRLYNLIAAQPTINDSINDLQLWAECVEQLKRIFHNGDLDETIAMLTPKLASPHITNLTQAFANRVLTIAYRLKRDETKALYHADEATSVITLDDEPYYYITFQQARAVVYYYLNHGLRSYYEKAITLLTECEQSARDIAEGYDFTHNAYSTGWCYAELREFENAREYFERGLKDATRADETYTIARMKYGLGYVQFAVGQYDIALQNSQDALKYFVNTSFLMTGVTLYIMSKCFTELGAYDVALDRLDNAIDNLKHVDNPGQLHHVYRQYSIVYFKKKVWLKMLAYIFRTYRIKLQYNMKLWPY